MKSLGLKVAGTLLLSTTLVGSGFGDFLNSEINVQTAHAEKQINGSSLVVPKGYYTELKSLPEDLLPLMTYDATKEQAKYRYVVKKDTTACVFEKEYTKVGNGVTAKFVNYNEIKLKAKEQMKFEVQSFFPHNGTIYAQVYISDGTIKTKDNLEWVSICIKVSDLKVQL